MQTVVGVDPDPRAMRSSKRSPSRRRLMRSEPAARLTTFLAVVFITASLAGCSSSATEALQRRTIDCSTRIDAIEDPPVEFSNVVLDAVAFPANGWPFGARKGDPGTTTDGFVFTKFGLVVRPDIAVTIDVVEPAASDFVMDWPPQKDAPAGHGLSVGPCADDDGNWVVFAGGVWLREPTCVTFDVQTSGKSERVDLGLGLDCAEG